MKFTNGLPETTCGAGSTVLYTTQLRVWLTRLMHELKVRTLVDAPCGDFNWMAHTDLSGIDYIGIDSDGDHVALANRMSIPTEFTPRSKTILFGDLVDNVPPFAHLILCREFLQHLPYEKVFEVLRNFKSSGSLWLLTTCHDNVVNNDLRKVGGFRPLNLMLPPFSFPPPVRYVEDCVESGRILALWPCRAV